jgi:dTDP-4-amino-4,6-dideoxygalactose transaminase
VYADGFRWLHHSFGTNARMMEMQAVIGRIQLKRMSEWTARRQANAAAIDTAVESFDMVRRVEVPGDCEHACYKHFLFVRTEKLAQGWTRDRISEAINAQGVFCYEGRCSEVYLEKAFDNTGWRPSPRLPNAKLLGETCLMFLVHPTLTDAEIIKTCTVLAEVLSAAGREA